ncbi:MAG: transcriptional repressor LexA, partial [Firmicutes bacterium]|nr:transcriptional repressor LexA [Bacillota bacterium]
IREICKATVLSSTSSVHLHLANLEKKGYINRTHSKMRHIEILENDFYTNNNNPEFENVPIIGTVSAGVPITAEENIDGYFPVPVSYLKNNNTFMLRISGDSMINAGIFNNDLVLVNQQVTAEDNDIIIALIENDATCKRFFRDNDKIRLQPENPDYEPIIVDDIKVLGKVIGLFRTF